MIVRVIKNLLILSLFIEVPLLWGFADSPKVISLEEAIEMGLKNSYTLQILMEKITQSEALQRKALALLLPVLSAQGTYTRNDKEVNMQFPDINSIKFNRTYPFIEFEHYNTYIIQKENSFGAIANLSIPLINIPNFLSYKNARESVELSELNKETQRGELIYNITQAYLNAISIKKSIAITERSIELAKSHLRTVEAKLKNGDANELSLVKAKLEVERSISDLFKLEKAYRLSIESLKVLINTDIDIEIYPNTDFKTEIEGDLEHLKKVAFEKRLDIKTLRKNSEIIERDLSITKSRFLPTLTMNATYRYSDTPSFIGDETQWFIIFSLNLNLYDGGIRYAEMKEKRSRLQENSLQLKQLTDSITSQIEQSLIEYDTCQKNVDSLKRQLELARRSYELSAKSYEIGIIPQTDLIESEVMATTTEILLEKEKNDCKIYYIKLLKATGEINSFKGK
jgi:outer membrane protein TolC